MRSGCVKLQEIMTGDVVQISPGESIGDAGKRMRGRAVGCLVVTSNGAIKGIITDRDLLACIDQRHNPYECQVALHMNRPVVVLQPDEDHLTALNVMYKKRIKRLPVAKDGKLLGIISLTDLAVLAESDQERLESSALLVSAVIKAQGAQGGRSRLRISTERGLPTSIKEQTLGEQDTAKSGEMASVL
jgi:CBS domain-containing protein